MLDSKIFYSSVSQTLSDQVLLRGKFLSFLGGIFFIIPGIIKFSPLYSVLFLSGGLLFITKGLFSYKKLKKLQTKPYKLVVDETGLQFFSANKLQLALSFSQIQTLHYEEKGTWFGIVVNNTYFFPFFKERVLKEILEIRSLE